MKISKPLLFMTLFTLFHTNAFAAVPKCWRADQTTADIVDGEFEMNYQTAGKSAIDVANLLHSIQFDYIENGLTPSLTGIYTNNNDSSLLIYFSSEKVLPEGISTENTTILKQAILTSLNSILSKFPGTGIRCVNATHMMPHPGGAVSNTRHN